MNESNAPEIIAEITDCLNDASWQNSVPFLRSLDIRNSSSEPLTSVRLTIDATPGFLRPKSWHIERIAAGETFSILDRDVELDPSYLTGLNEAEKCSVRLRVLQSEQVVTETHCGIRLLARDEWGGMGSMAELLPAFIMPNDPAISSLLKTAGQVLEKHGHSPALDGYQSRDPRRAYLLTAALWSAVAEKRLTYANPPSSFEQIGQKVRRPATVLSDGLATCLDSTLLFASAIEAMGLNPNIVMVEGHCFVGVWLVEKTARQLIEPDCGEIRKAIAARELTTFETTLITHRPAASFEEAIKSAAARTRESQEDLFTAAIDVRRARSSGIKPLASHHAGSTSSVAVEESEGEPLPLAPVPSFEAVASEEVEEKPTTSTGRIERWQRKLLDLSLRNRLLNFKVNKQSIPVVCPDLASLEDRLADGKKLRLISLPDENPIGQRDPELHQQRTKQDLNIEFARQSLERNEIACSISKADLSNRLTTLYRSARNDLIEGGSNTLFLAVGFLKWKRPEESRSYRAPLLLVPVKLVRKSAISPYSLALHEDEVRFNATLIQMIKKDFGRDLSGFENDLPRDESGIDVSLVMERMRREVREIPGFEVVDETVLAKFSFAKYLMWKDLVDRIDQLEKNRVVKHLIHDPDKSFVPAISSSIPQSHEMDRRYDPKELYHPLPADSSQLAAIMAASEGHDFVLIGPPGTGKSQTIANMITQCLANKKTVLFVAEKTAALEVVHRRLRQHGLGDCCLELHSNKAERKKFLEQLETSWKNNRRASRRDWIEINHQLKVRRDELNAYVSSLHEQHPNGWSVYRALGTVVKANNSESPRLDWAESVQHDPEAYQSITRIIADLALTATALEKTVPLPMIQAQDWSATWESRLLSQCEILKTEATKFRETLRQFADILGISDKKDCSSAELEAFGRLAQVLPVCQKKDLGIIFHKQFAQFPAALAELRKRSAEYRETARTASACYERESLDRIPVDEMDLQWRQACASFWPMSWFAKRKVIRLLQSYATSGIANPVTDLPAIRIMRQQLAAIGTNLLAEFPQHWKGMETSTDALHSILKTAGELRESIVRLGRPMKLTDQITRAMYTHLKGESNGRHVEELTGRFRETMKTFSAAVQKYVELAGTLPYTEQTSAIGTEVLEAIRQIQTHRTQIRQWTAWCEVKKQAEVAGLNSFLQEVESNRISASALPRQFELSYARWWLPGVIDRSDQLRKFQRFRHEDAIQTFRQLDDQARVLSAEQAKQAIAHQLPSPDSVPKKSELGLLRHQMSLKRPSKSIREIISGMPDSFGKLAPCMMMSPLSIAQYLPASHPPFDVVIFDEASQITTWDAIGAIARGKQTIIVGDPKQLPPTSFFGKADDDSDDDEISDHDKDLESILDEAKASGLRPVELKWHYRSRHESLIAFSNEKYYRNLVTFPSADSQNLGVRLRHLPEAVYDRGKSRTNIIEAQAIVDEAVARMKECLSLPEKDRQTFGVVTFNSEQQSLIQDLFDQAIGENSELEWYFSDDRIEPTMVKNLENVQGDERDVMYFSITFSPNAVGTVPLNFGALNRDGGERRLNVAVTRARQQLVVFSSFKADQLKAERSGKRGIVDLKAFLDYAEKGPLSLFAGPGNSVGEYDSPFEEAVAEALTAKGWQTTPQVGVSAFRVDIGIVHPDKPGAFLAGIECDGATYHRSVTARDRDKTRQLILESLGWKILRVWSSDWWYDPQSAIQGIHQRLEELLQESRKPATVSPQEEKRDSNEIFTTPSDSSASEPASESHSLIAANAIADHDDTEPFRLVGTPALDKQSSSLDERILVLLRRKPNLKAREIARELKVERSDVNSALYGALEKHVVQDGEYRWKVQ